MKRLFTLLTVLCMTVVMSAATTNYDLWVMGKQVTSSNASDVLGTNAVSYNASTKTLTLKQTYLESPTDEVIYSKIDGLTINVSGTVYLRSTNKDRSTLSLNGKTTFTGTSISSSSLTITRYDASGGTGYQPIRANCNVEIKNLTMRVSNLNGGAAIRPLYTPDDASNPTAYNLTVRDADVTFVAGGSHYPIYGFKSVSLSGCSLNPMTYYNTDAKTYYVADNSGKGVTGKDIVIKNRKYGSIGNNYVIDDYNNASCISSSLIKPTGLNKGTISLREFANGGGKYLLLDGVDFSNSEGVALGLRLESEEPCHFEIILKGSNKIAASLPIYISPNSSDNVFIKASSSATTTPSLTLQASQHSGIDVRCPNLYIENIDLNVKGMYGGISGSQGYSSSGDYTLTFRNTEASITDESTAKVGAIDHFKTVSYTDCYFFNQVNYEWETTAYYNPYNSVANYVSVHRGYGICINDCDVTKDNRYDVFGDGKVSYNPSTKTLYLNNVNYKTKSSPLFVFTPITINLIGTNTLTTTSDVAALNVFANTTITSSTGASLAANNETTYEGHGGIIVNQAALTIKDCTVSAYCPNGYGVKGKWMLTFNNLPGTSTLTLNNASLRINNSSKYNSIDNFKNLTLTDCYYDSPGSATFDSANGYVKNGSTPIRGELEISNGYGFVVGGTRVTKDNASNIKPGVTYDASTNTMKFNNGKVTGDYFGIVAYKDLNLYVSGTANSIYSTSNHGILAYGNVNITGPDKDMSSLTINTNGTQGCAGIYLNSSGSKFNVKNTTLSVHAANSNSYGIIGSKTAATIQDAEVAAYGTSASTYSLSSLSLIGVEILSPVNAVFTPGTGVTLNGSIVAAKEVKIGAKEYDLSVGGKKITSANSADVFGDGKVKYDPATNTLTLNNAIIACEGYGIEAKTKQRLYINLIGTSIVQSLRSYALYHDNTNGITIQSSSNGTLNLSGSYIGSFQEAGNLTIKNCMVKANGIQGKEGNNYCTLNIENANVTSECSFGGAFKWIDNILLTNCYVSEPVGAVFNSAQGGYLSAGTLCNKVVIKSGTNAIEGVTIDDDTDAPAYDFRGVQVDKSYNGIVIKNGRKYIQK